MRQEYIKEHFIELERRYNGLVDELFGYSLCEHPVNVWGWYLLTRQCLVRDVQYSTKSRTKDASAETSRNVLAMDLQAIADGCGAGAFNEARMYGRATHLRYERLYELVDAVCSNRVYIRQETLNKHVDFIMGFYKQFAFKQAARTSTGSNILDSSANAPQIKELKEQIALIALLKAIRNFNPHTPIEFMTHLVHHIRNEASRDANDYNLISVPNTVYTKNKHIKKYIDSYYRKNGSYPTREHLEAHFNEKDLPLDLPLASASDCALTIKDNTFSSSDNEDTLINREVLNSGPIKKALDSLSEIERAVVLDRFGVKHCELLKDKKPAYIHSIKDRALRKLRLSLDLQGITTSDDFF